MRLIVLGIVITFLGCATDPIPYRRDDGADYTRTELDRAEAHCELQADLAVGQLVGIGVFFYPWVYEGTYERCMRGEGFVAISDP